MVWGPRCVVIVAIVMHGIGFLLRMVSLVILSLVMLFRILVSVLALTIPVIRAMSSGMSSGMSVLIVLIILWIIASGDTALELVVLSMMSSTAHHRCSTGHRCRRQRRRTWARLVPLIILGHKVC